MDQVFNASIVKFTGSLRNCILYMYSLPEFVGPALCLDSLLYFKNPDVAGLYFASVSIRKLPAFLSPKAGVLLYLAHMLQRKANY